jgi:hypothetical protein
MKKKYLVISDYVISKTDGQRHFITCSKLMYLYSVREEECICMESSIKGRYTPSIEDYKNRYGNLIELRPKYDGNYIIG